MATLSEKNPATVSVPDRSSVDDIDPLSELFSSTLSAAVNPNRLCQYKCRIREETNQESRRRLILQQQKEKRNAKFNQRRNVEVEKRNDVGDWFEEEICIEEDDLNDEMEWCTIKTVAWHKQGSVFRDLLMYSEWLEDIPSDFSKKWIMLPCPAGKRTLIVSKQTITTAYSKKGIAVSYFKSLLPPRTMLDTIWCYQRKSFYVLDVIQWNGMSFKNCQTDFRFYWLDSKFEEMPELSVKSRHNCYPMTKLPRCACCPNEISDLVINYPLFPNNFPKLDGLLFYHRETHYMSGYTPLVGWLKCFMLPDACGISVPNEYSEQKPEDYTNYKEFISVKDEKRKIFWANKRRRCHKNKMDCDENSSDSVIDDSIDDVNLDDENC